MSSREGVVLASDGQVTSHTDGQPTRRPDRKLFDLGHRVAWGSAGSAGLQQTLRERLDGMAGDLSGGNRLRERLAEAVIPIQQRALAQYVPHPGSEPPDLSCLFCWCDAGRPWILEVPRTGGDHQLHRRFAAIGTGEIFAKFALASVGHLAPERLDLERAKMVAYKAIADAIEVAAIYLGPPIQMYVVDDGGARRVPPAEVEGGLADSVDAWKARQLEALGPLAPRRSRLTTQGRRARRG
ncbi:MAG: hypothetical protein ACRDL6_11480 [Solirubrobacterales bacterium]